jgi:hypothetical protein
MEREVGPAQTSVLQRFPKMPAKPVINRTLEMLKKSLKQEKEKRGAASTLLS